MPRRLIVLLTGFLALLWCVQWGWVRWKLADWDERVAVLVAEGFLPARNEDSPYWTVAEYRFYREWTYLEGVIGAALGRAPAVWTNDAQPLTPSMASSLSIHLDSLSGEFAGLDALLDEARREGRRTTFAGFPRSAAVPRSPLLVVGCAIALGKRALDGTPGTPGADSGAFATLFDYVVSLREGSALTLERWRLERYALRCLRRALQDPDVDARALVSSLDSRLKEMAGESRYRAALQRHFAFHLDVDYRPHVSAGWAVFERGAVLDQHAWLLAGFERLVRIVPIPGELPRNDQGVLEFPGRDLDGVRGVPLGRPSEYVQNGLTAIEREYQSLRRALQLARVALALAAYRQVEGHWPAGLADLDPSAGPDPATGEPFVYGSTGNEIWLMAADLSHLGPAFSSAPIDDLLRWTWAR